jgi:hypothetical protein
MLLASLASPISPEPKRSNKIRNLFLLNEIKLNAHAAGDVLSPIGTTNLSLSLSLSLALNQGMDRSFLVWGLPAHSLRDREKLSS